MSKKMFLIDGSALYYRSYFAFIRNPLINSKGEDTSTTYGFLMALVRLIEDEQPDYLSIVFDTKEPTFRHEIYDEYKANRQKMPEEMSAQYPRLIQTLDALQFNRIEKAGFEADDIIGTFVEQYAADDLDVFIVSSDKDMAQLVKEHVYLYALPKASQKAEIIGTGQVFEKMGVEAYQVIDFLALMGDSSDNIPGVPKVGKKTAANLLEEYDNLDNLYQQLDSLKEGAVKNNLEEHREQAELSQLLATIKIDVPLDVTLDNLQFNMWDIEVVSKIMAELEFRTLATRMQKLAAAHGAIDMFENFSEDTSKSDYQLVRTESELQELIRSFKKQKEFVFDLETDSLDFLVAKIAGIALSWHENEAYYIPMEHNDFSLDKQKVFELIKPIFADANIAKIAHNIKFDAQILEMHGVPVSGIYFDTMLASYLLNPAGQHKLDKVSEQFLNYEMIHIEELIGKGKNQKKMTELPATDVVNYAAEDADITYRLYKILHPKIHENAMDDLLYKIEMPLVRTLMQMERDGIALDKALIEDLSTKTGQMIESLKTQIFDQSGEEFNLNSPQQLGTILFDKLDIQKELNLKKPPKTKTGQYSTSEKILERYLGHPLVEKIMNYRKLSKLKNTYLDALPELVHQVSGKVHTSYNQSVAATGRLSSSNPNLQNIPIRTEIGREIRKAFIPSKKDYVILSLDYSQIELRIMAHLSADQAMIDSFQSDLDIHAATAARIFNIPLEEVSTDHRRKAKEINFGIIYGMSRFGLASRLHITAIEAEEFIKDYFATYPGISYYMQNTIDSAVRLGYVETMMQRRRYLPEIKSTNRQIREFAERTAINTPIQGSAADLIKIAMNQIYQLISEKKPAAKMLLQVHDELVFEVHQDILIEFTAQVKEIMESAFELKVPVKVDSGSGSNWLEAH